MRSERHGSSTARREVSPKIRRPRTWARFRIAAGLLAVLAAAVLTLLQADLLAAPAVGLVLATWFAIAASTLLRRLVVTFGPNLVRSARTRWETVSSRRAGLDAASGESAGRVPGVPVWLAKRLGRGPRGLALTTAVTTFILCAVAVLLLGQRVTEASSEIARFDLRVANLAALPESQDQRPLMSALTEIGRARVIGPVMALIFIGAVAAGVRKGAVLMIAIPAVTSVTVTALKSFHARPRPNFGQLLEASASFPSGHSAGGFAFAAGVIAMARLSGIKRLWLVSAVVLPFGMLVGYSRAYLSVHWTSDVVGGWLVAGAVASLLTAFALLLPAGNSARVDHRKIAAGIVAGSIVAIATGFWGTEVRFPDFPEIRAEPVASLDAVLEDLPPTTETLLGRQDLPVNLVATASAGQWSRSLARVGFERVPPASTRSLLESVAGLEPAPIPGPTFLDSSVHDYVGVTTAGRSQIVVRAWRLPVVLPDGCEVWAAAVTRSDGAGLDRVRNDLVEDLSGSGFSLEGARPLGPAAEKALAPEGHRTDGKAAVLRTDFSCGFE